MNAEFNWWLLIVGLVVGAGLVWLVIADWSRREEDLSADERTAESAWIAQTLQDRGEVIDPGAAEEVLALHRAYLRQTGVLETVPEPTEPTDTEPEVEPEAEPDVEWGADTGPEPDAEVEPEPEPDTIAADTRPDDRPSVRSTPLSPRGAQSGLESDPPA